MVILIYAMMLEYYHWYCTCVAAAAIASTTTADGAIASTFESRKMHDGASASAFLERDHTRVETPSLLFNVSWILLTVFPTYHLFDPLKTCCSLALSARAGTDVQSLFFLIPPCNFVQQRF